MEADFEFQRKDLTNPVVFRRDFNAHNEVVTANQAWSLFFTGGQKDKILGLNPEVGRFFTGLLIVVSVTGILSSLLFSGI